MLKIILISIMSATFLSAAKVPVYLGSGSEEGISYVLLDSETGELTGLKQAVKTSVPNSLVVSKDKKFIFSAVRKGGKIFGNVTSFAIQPDGNLKLINEQNSMGTNPCHVSLDQDSKFLFVANYSSGTLANYRVDGSGKISYAVSHFKHRGSSVHPTRQKRPHVHSIYCSPDNRFVYSADLGIDKVMIYKLDQESGKMLQIGGAELPAGSGPRHMAFSKDGKILYVLNELTLTVSRFIRDEKSGSLELESTKSVMAELAAGREGMSCSEIQVSDDGRFIYAACRDLDNKKRDSISVLNAVDLSIIQEQLVGAWIPRHFGISPSGKWMLIAGQKENKVVVKARDKETGKLSDTSHSIEVDKPMWILFP